MNLMAHHKGHKVTFLFPSQNDTACVLSSSQPATCEQEKDCSLLREVMGLWTFPVLPNDQYTRGGTLPVSPWPLVQSMDSNGLLHHTE